MRTSAVVAMQFSKLRFDMGNGWWKDNRLEHIFGIYTAIFLVGVLLLIALAGN